MYVRGCGLVLVFTLSRFDTQCSGFGFQTTIMAVEFADGVVVGADSRTTTGYVHVFRVCVCVYVTSFLGDSVLVA